MQKYGRLLLKSILLLCGAVAVGILLMVLVFRIPTAPMQKQMEESAQTFAQEGTYPLTRSLFVTDNLDNYTDALMLLNASYEGEEGLLDRSMTVYRYNMKGKSPDQVLTSVYQDHVPKKKIKRGSYGRYWHGYLLVIKPLLLLLNYRQIRMVNAVCLALVTAILLFLMWKRGLGAYVVTYLLSVLMIGPAAIAKSLQFSNIAYISSAAAILFLWKEKELWEREERLVLFFLCVGCATSFFDYLTYPLLTFGVLATLFVCADNRAGAGKKAKLLFLMLAAWGFGYVGMWAGKWLAGSLLGSENIIESALSKLSSRSSMQDAAGNGLDIFAVLQANLIHYRTKLLWAAGAYVLAALIFWCRRIFFAADKKAAAGVDGVWLLYLGLALLPVCWMAGAGNHSYVHNFFTYREFFLSFFAGMSLFARYAWDGRMKQNKRHN